MAQNNMVNTSKTSYFKVLYRIVSLKKFKVYYQN